MVLLLFAAQVIIHLYATSVLTSATTGAAETVADSGDPVASVATAEAEARRDLGSFGTDCTFEWKEVDGNQIVLEVKGRSPGLLPLSSAWTDIARTVTVRTERFR